MRIDLFTSDWHKLIKPVLPHAATDKELSWLRRIRLEVGDRALYAIATDMSTLAAERRTVARADQYQAAAVAPVHVEAPEAKASLAIFPYDKESDPPLQVTIDQATFAIDGHTITSWAVTLYRPDDGTRIMLRDRRDPAEVTSLDAWRKGLLAALTREHGRALDGLDLRGPVLARWAAACRGAERMRLYTGPEPGQPLLITVESHFAGLMTISQYLDTPAQGRSQLPWAGELLPAGISDDADG